ncbi:MAG TPA: hypothetical protein VNP71_07970 [Thermoplasmata archaeon]|nr:hypothetical protein [Thermoplasmata archaeon]
MPIVHTWHNPQQTFRIVKRYLDTKDHALWPAIIDYWIGELFLLRSDAEAERVSTAKRKKEESKK